jgi:hypothetical protein
LGGEEVGGGVGDGLSALCHLVGVDGACHGGPFID